MRPEVVRKWLLPVDETFQQLDFGQNVVISITKNS